MCLEQNNIYTDALKAAVAAVLNLEKSSGGGGHSTHSTHSIGYQNWCRTPNSLLLVLRMPGPPCGISEDLETPQTNSEAPNVSFCYIN